MKYFRMSDIKALGAGSCSLERMHGPITKAHHDFLESVVPGEQDELISKDLLDCGEQRVRGWDWTTMTANNPSWAATIPADPPFYYDPPSYYELRTERDELQVEVHELASQLERLEDQLKMYKHRGDMLQGVLMTLRDAAKQTADTHDAMPGRCPLSVEIEALRVRVYGANTALTAYGEDPY